MDRAPLNTVSELGRKDDAQLLRLLEQLPAAGNACSGPGTGLGKWGLLRVGSSVYVPLQVGTKAERGVWEGSAQHTWGPSALLVRPLDPTNLRGRHWLLFILAVSQTRQCPGGKGGGKQGRSKKPRGP